MSYPCRLEFEVLGMDNFVIHKLRRILQPGRITLIFIEPKHSVIDFFLGNEAVMFQGPRIRRMAEDLLYDLLRQLLQEE